LAHLQETVRLAPRHAQAQNNLGGVLRVCGQPAEAVRHLREAIRLKPVFAEAYSNLGLALRDLNQIGEAAQCFREALRIDPAYSRARNHLGFALLVQGKAAEALAEFQETLRRDPGNSHAVSGLSRLAAAGHFRFSDEEIRRLQELTARPGIPLQDLCRLHFALARVLDKARSFAEAFEHCRRGNELRRELDRRRGVVFDPARQRELVDKLIAAYTPAYFARVRPFGLDSELPVFIVGMLRSGTSLAEQILASHPQIHGAGELEDLNRLAGTLPQRLGAAISYPECVALLDGATARAVASVYLQKLKRLGGDALRVVDKMPMNFLHVGLIATLFPKARFIHCRRDPMDTCVSCFFQNFADPQPFALDLEHLGLFYREYERLMAHWTRVLPVTVFELSYEELTANQEAASRRLVAFCGLEWNERCLNFHDTQRAVRTASSLQVRQPMYRTSVGRWKNYETQLQPLLKSLSQNGDRTLEF
jgi:tetratricopeptide (TPR) repeat protein